MEKLDDILAAFTNKPNKTRSAPKKRKWREIEALKEKHQLKKELEELDWTADYAIDDLSIN